MNHMREILGGDSAEAVAESLRTFSENNTELDAKWESLSAKHDGQWVGLGTEARVVVADSVAGVIAKASVEGVDVDSMALRFAGPASNLIL